MSRNMPELCVKFHKATIYPPWGPIKKIKNILLPHLKCKTCSEGDIWKISRRRIADLKNQGLYNSQFCKKWEDALHFRENGLAITFTWPNEPKFTFAIMFYLKFKKGQEMKHPMPVIPIHWNRGGLVSGCFPSIDRLAVESPAGWQPGWLMVVSGRRSSQGLLPKYLLPAEQALMDPDLYGLSCGSRSAQLGLLWQGRQLVDITIVPLHLYLPIPTCLARSSLFPNK